MVKFAAFLPPDSRSERRIDFGSGDGVLGFDEENDMVNNQLVECPN